MNYIPCQSLYGNQVYHWASILAHNLGREIQMKTISPQLGTTKKRSPRWKFKSLGTIQSQLIHRVSRINGKLTFTLNANRKVKP